MTSTGRSQCVPVSLLLAIRLAFRLSAPKIILNMQRHDWLWQSYPVSVVAAPWTLSSKRRTLASSPQVPPPSPTVHSPIPTPVLYHTPRFLYLVRVTPYLVDLLSSIGGLAWIHGSRIANAALRLLNFTKPSANIVLFYHIPSYHHPRVRPM